MNNIDRVAGVTENNKYFTEMVRHGNDMTVCGPGSTLFATRHIIRELPLLIKRHNIKSILDLPCGDYNWMSKVDLCGATYIGADANAAMISINKNEYPHVDFRVIDIIKDEIPKVDLIISRDIFPHLPFEDISSAFKNIKNSGSKYLLSSTFSWRYEEPRDVPRISEHSTGIAWRRLNLFMEPFNLPPCLDFIIEFNQEGDAASIGYGDKMLGMWDCNSL